MVSHSTSMSEEISIEDLPGVGEKTAEKLREAGFYDVMAIAAASPGELAAIAEIGELAANKMIATARQKLDIGFETATSLLAKRKELKRISTNAKGLDALLGEGSRPRQSLRLMDLMGLGKASWHSSSRSMHNFQ